MPARSDRIKPHDPERKEIYTAALVGGVRLDIRVDGGIGEESDRKEEAIILFNGDYR